MKTYRILFYLIFCATAVQAQYTVDDFVGNWYVLHLHEITVNDTIQFNKKVLESAEDHYMEWILDEQMQVEIVKVYPVCEKQDTNTIWHSEFNIKWQFYKETLVLKLGEQSYKVLYLDQTKLKLLRII